MSASAPPASRLPVVNSGTTLIHLDFLVTGVVMTFLGPMLPYFSARWNLSDTRSGALIFAEFFSSMFGMLLSGVLVEQIGYRLTLMVGLALMPAGMTLLAFGPWTVGLIAISIFGVGYGITTPAGNLRTAEINPENSAAALNVINAVWGVGAMSSPFLVALALRARRPNAFLFGTAAFLVGLFVALACSRFVPDIHVHGKKESLLHSFANFPILPFVCVLFFVYVGTETAFGNWAAMYAERISPEHKSLATMAPAFFWGALLFGRASAPFALKFRRETAVARSALVLGLLGGATLVLAHGMQLVLAGCFLAGLGLSSIFPISVSLLPRWFGESARSVSGAVFGSGNIGGAVLPWIVGLVSTHTGNLRWGYFVPFTGVVFMLAFYASQKDTKSRAMS